MAIAVLDAQTVGRIAAGEVVERPASVAKELIENALDAGSTAITVEIRDGGAKYLRVTDNGCGIAPEEARIAFENHATSKIRSGDLLDNLCTMGFRGEALPSIAAVSRVTMTTRKRQADAGVRLKIEGGRFEGIQDIGCPEGTTITVEDLFFNVPARQAFLKRPATEAGAVCDLVQRMILGYPSVAFRYMQNGRVLYHSTGDGDLRHAAFAVYGREVAEKLDIIQGELGGMKLEGLLGTGELSRPGRSSEYFFINGRSVRCTLLARTLEEMLAGRVLTGQFPICALSLTVPSSAVDVNVHPSKLEVRFRDENMIRMSLEAILGQALAPKAAMLDREDVKQASPVQVQVLKTLPRQEPSRPPMPEETAVPQERIRMYPSGKLSEPYMGSGRPEKPTADIMEALRRQEENKAIRVSEDPRPSPRPTGIRADGQAGLLRQKERETEVKAAEEQRKAAEKKEPIQVEQLAVESEQLNPLPPYRVIGVFMNAYILVEAGEKLIMIDQHAAHERILFEKFQKQIARGVAMQTLMIPQVFPATARETAIVADNRETLLEAGFDAEPMGDTAVQVRSVPFILGQTVTKPLFLEMIDDLDRLKDAAAERRHEIIINAACKHAVKAGEALTEGEIEELVRIMATTDAPPVCAHGRPVLKVWTKNDIEKMFKRT